jgi:phosphatidylinositol glycan class B
VTDPEINEEKSFKDKLDSKEKKYHDLH